jgi:hypothetical protein
LNALAAIYREIAPSKTIDLTQYSPWATTHVSGVNLASKGGERDENDL